MYPLLPAEEDAQKNKMENKGIDEIDIMFRDVPELGTDIQAAIFVLSRRKYSFRRGDVRFRSRCSVGPGAVAAGFSAGVQAHFGTWDPVTDQRRHPLEALIDRWHGGAGHAAILGRV